MSEPSIYVLATRLLAATDNLRAEFGFGPITREDLLIRAEQAEAALEQERQANALRAARGEG